MMPWLGSWANWYTPHPLPLFPQMALSSSCIPSHTRTRTRTVFAESLGHRIRVGSIQSVQLQPFTWSGQWTSAFSWSMELCPHLRHKHTHKHTHTHTHPQMPMEAVVGRLLHLHTPAVCAPAWKNCSLWQPLCVGSVSASVCVFVCVLVRPCVCRSPFGGTRVESPSVTAWATTTLIQPTLPSLSTPTHTQLRLRFDVEHFFSSWHLTL